MRHLRGKNQGFTLIELSIVLVIIGLIVGGILVGQDLIGAAATRAQISQIEKFNSAVNTFRVKYGYLPGDIPDPYASQFGFVARGLNPGQGDGNGLLQGFWTLTAPYTYGTFENCGETTVFWTDLSTANMIDGNFSTANNIYNGTPTGSTSLYLPVAKIGAGNYVYAWSGGSSLSTTNTTGDGINYFGISAVTQLGAAIFQSSPGMSVQQAYNIDKKIDDGLPQSGNVQAIYLDYSTFGWPPGWAGSGGQTGVPYTTATSGSATTCFDNRGTASTMQYSMEISNGSNVNCALSFKMQGAAR